MEFTGAPSGTQNRVLLEAWDTFGYTSPLQAVRRYADLAPGNAAFFPTSLGSGTVIRTTGGVNTRRSQITGAAFNGASCSDSVYGVPLAQIVATMIPAEGARALRRYTFAVNVLMSATDPAAFVEVGFKTGPARMETTAGTWGVVAAIRGASTWQGCYKLTNGGAFVAGAASGLSPTAARRITLIYEESPSSPSIYVKVGNQTILTLTGQANMPVVADGVAAAFGLAIGGYSVGAVTRDVDFYDTMFRVEEI